MRSILLIDHGSVRDEANQMLVAAADLLQQTVGDARVVTWSFPIPADSPTGTGTVIATCNRATITSPIQIGSGLSR